MKITIKLFAVLERGRFNEKCFEYNDDMTVGEVVQSLRLPPEHVDILLVNGQHVTIDRMLVDGDVLSILPMVDGG